MRVTSTNPQNPLNNVSNLAHIVDWSTEWVFVDVMKSSRFWIPQMVQEYYSEIQRVWSTGETILIREDGYPISLQPGQAVGTLMQRDLQLHYPSGVYTCFYEVMVTLLLVSTLKLLA
jgi:hypothetical protein